MSGINLIECMVTWQGEGPDTGKYMLLCRFKNCQLNCPFCDTKIKMKNSLNGFYTLEEMQKAIDDIHGGLLITGGEPTMYIDELSTMLTELNYTTANVETNGFHLREILLQTKSISNVKFIFSPKNKLKEKDVSHYKNDNRVFYKFVIDRIVDTDINSINRQSLELLKKQTDNLQNVYLMPKGTTPHDLKNNSKLITDLAEMYKCNISTRMHLIYNFY